MNTGMNRWKFMLAGLYAWIVSSFFGAILLDIVYSRAVSIDLNPSDTATLFSRGADFLLLLSTLTLLAGVAAIGFAWSHAVARNLLIVSLFFVAVELFTPFLLGSLLLKVQANSGLHTGMWIRLAGSALSSILAFLALWRLHPSTS
jgi:hypothetical protein